MQPRIDYYFVSLPQVINKKVKTPDNSELIYIMNKPKILFPIFLLVCVQAMVSAQSGVVETKYGKVEGYREENIRIYKGIPFAAPAIGDLRWKAPQPPVSWHG